MQPEAASSDPGLPSQRSIAEFAEGGFADSDEAGRVAGSDEGKMVAMPHGTGRVRAAAAFDW